jgi:hypothetical protein
MAQHDYVIANGTGAAVRSDINDVLSAIVTQNSGTSEPATTYAYQWWADTTTGLLKIRNAANNAWVTVGTLASANLGLLSSGATITAALGTAGTPGITFTGDLNTGIYSPGADQVAISTNGTGRLFVDSSGRVLVGTTAAFNTSSDALIQAVNTSGGEIVIGRDFALGSGSTIGRLAFFTKPSAVAEAARIEAVADALHSGGAPSRLVFSTTAVSASSPTERMRIDSSGRVGIGTATPDSILHLAFTNSTAPTSGTTPSGIGLSVGGNNGDNGGIWWSADFGQDQGICGIAGAKDNSYETSLRFYTNNTNAARGFSERARIDSSGRLLIGTSSSLSVDGIESLFQIQGTSFTASQSIVRHGGPGALLLGSSGGSSIGSTTVVSNGNDIGAVRFIGADGSDFNSIGAEIKCQVDGTPGSNDMPGRLVFSTTADGASSPTERMRITSDGDTEIRSGNELRVYRGDDTRYGRLYTNNSATILEADPALSDPLRLASLDRVEFYTAGSEAMRINSSQELLIGYTSDNGAYKLQVNSQIFATSATVATSDGRYKENVATLGGCLDLIKALRPVSFTWKPQEDITRTDDDGNEVLVREGHNFPEGTQIGFIAQEVQEVLVDKPWLGSVIKENIRPAVEDNEGNELAPEEQFFGIAEGNLIAVLTNALQEAIAKIETLEAKVAALEAS